MFPGLKVRGAYQFRVTRDSELELEEDETENLARALSEELMERGYAEAVRLELAEGCPTSIEEMLLANFGLKDADVYQCAGPVNLHRVAAVYDIVDRPDLKFPPFTPRIPAAFVAGANIFETLAQRDVLLHHPFESFAPVMEMLRQASADPDVLAIKQTLYRVGEDSPLAGYLIDAARAGKEVTVVIELRARFDEEANIRLANRLQKAGAQVVYGVVGYKTHAKMLLIVRRENGILRRYAAVMGTATVLRGARGACIAPEDVPKFARCMADLLRQPGWREAMAAAGPIEARAWSAETMTARLLTVYAAVGRRSHLARRSRKRRDATTSLSCPDDDRPASERNRRQKSFFIPR